MRSRAHIAAIVVISAALTACKTSSDSGAESSEPAIVGLTNPGVVTASHRRAQEMTVQVDLARVHSSIQMYWASEGRPPATLDELVGPSAFLDELPTDPWGRVYGYQRTESDTFRLYSLGPDGRAGSDDDIPWGD